MTAPEREIRIKRINTLYSAWYAEKRQEEIDAINRIWEEYFSTTAKSAAQDSHNSENNTKNDCH